MSQVNSAGLAIPADSRAPDRSAAVDVENLKLRVTSKERDVHVLNGVTFKLMQGEILSLIGESGSGKSMTLRALMGLLPRYGTHEGKVVVSGKEILKLPAGEARRMRGPTIAMVFQEPLSALDPVFTIGQQLVETIMEHGQSSAEAARKRAIELLDMVRIPSPAARMGNYPHEMSGGMRQRAMIALALSCRPEVLLADEPTTALDVSVQIQIILLLRELQRELGMSVIFVTHDVGAAIEVADRIAVMYAGTIIEAGTCADILHRHKHPYTHGLLASTLHDIEPGTRLSTIEGSPPDLLSAPRGCSFAPRCKWAAESCWTEFPPITHLSPSHYAFCSGMDPDVPYFAMRNQPRDFPAGQAIDRQE